MEFLIVCPNGLYLIRYQITNSIVKINIAVKANNDEISHFNKYLNLKTKRKEKKIITTKIGIIIAEAIFPFLKE